LRSTMADTGLDEDAEHALEVAFRAAIVEARAEGLIMSAGFVEVVETEPDQPQLLAGHVFVVARPAGNLAGALSPVAWMATLAEAERDGDITPLKPPEIVMLGEHEAVRSVEIEELSRSAGEPRLTIFGVNYYLSFGGGHAILVIGFRTPCVWMADAFEELFADIAATLQIDL